MDYDKIAIIISIFSLGVSLLTLYKENKNNKTNLKAEYFKQLYMNLLIEYIPKKRLNMKFNNGKLEGYKAFVNAINQLVSKSMYYKYVDVNYYNNLKNHIVGLEDYVLETANNIIRDEFQNGVFDEIEIRIGHIYDCLESKYTEG